MYPSPRLLRSRAPIVPQPWNSFSHERFRIQINRNQLGYVVYAVIFFHIVYLKKGLLSRLHYIERQGIEDQTTTHSSMPVHPLNFDRNSINFRLPYWRLCQFLSLPFSLPPQALSLLHPFHSHPQSPSSASQQLASHRRPLLYTLAYVLAGLLVPSSGSELLYSGRKISLTSSTPLFLPSLLHLCCPLPINFPTKSSYFPCVTSKEFKAQIRDFN